MTGISRATLLRWLKEGILKQSTSDTRGWRLFTRKDLEKIRARANRVEALEKKDNLLKPRDIRHNLKVKSWLAERIPANHQPVYPNNKI